MKKKILILSLALSMFLVGCSKKAEEKPVEEPVAETAQEEVVETAETPADEVVEGDAEVAEPTEEEIKLFEDFQLKVQELSMEIGAEAAKAEDPAKAMEGLEEKILAETEKLMEDFTKEHNITIEELDEIFTRVAQYELSK